ncbi:hypothetical protein SAMN05216353_1048 [Halobacillus alkaliphilus]|uniref:Uncharacterized protein n=1 Tax=Halobacillus alkaliphilus TaxID=396056 RepID=A0A1I2KFF4_9BACI|nr:hypothetical protein [Halobacillus alkaliphilus]SFF63977.1 hypothetical protein SAMN05216353_1048 [Halobacillus alkaliphilus]
MGLYVEINQECLVKIMIGRDTMITAWIGSISFLAIAILYVLLALGLPYGEFAMGGKYKILPKQMRVACAISVLIQLAAILFILQAGDVISIDLIAPIAIGACYFFAFYLFLNTIMNLFSKSKKEKLVMTPLSFITAICFLITALNG